MELQIIQNKILTIRNQKVMLDIDLAVLYEVETRVLKQAVKRNIDRFPVDFMFYLTEQEIESLVSQSVIPSKKHLGGAIPMAFTEQGVAMLSSVLKSKTALNVNVAIMRTFVAMRQYALGYSELRDKIDQLEIEMNMQFEDIYKALTQMLDRKKEDKPPFKVGFVQ